MMYTKVYRELIAEKVHQSPTIETQEGETVDGKYLREVPEAGTTSQAAPEPSEAKQEGIMTFWASTSPKEELSRLQREDPDIGPILAAKMSGNKPSSPTTRHYWILWDSLEVQDVILLKTFFKRDHSGEYLQFIVPLSIRRMFFSRCTTFWCPAILAVRRRRKGSFKCSVDIP